MNVPTLDQIRFLWKQELGSSQVSWPQFTEDCPLEMEGHEQKLASLLQERYAITRAEADTQARNFLEKTRPRSRSTPT